MTTRVEARLDQILVSESLERSSPTLYVCGIREHERPLKGAAGELDWRLKGFLSRFLIRGYITGRYGELTYVPVLLRGFTRHILLVGTGSQSTAEAEKKLFRDIRGTMNKLSLSKIAISLGSFPETSLQELERFFEGATVEAAQ